MTSVEELYLTGLHLEQYRHPALSPEPYWQEALRRDAGDARSHIALGRGRFRAGDFAAAETHFRQAVGRLTRRNFNPYDGEAHYNLGLALKVQNRLEEAYRAFTKSTWAYPWQTAGHTEAAQIACQQGDYPKALAHLVSALQADPQNAKARNLQCAVLRRLGREDAAETLALETLASDPLDHWARYELSLAAADEAQLERLLKLTRLDVQTFLDIAFDYAKAAFWQEASNWLALAAIGEPLYPMVAYALGYFAIQSGEAEAGAAWHRRAAQADPDYCFPWRLEEMIVLQDALERNPADGSACYYLGNLLYDKQRFTEAVSLWQRAAAAKPDFAIPWRNLGLASFNRERDIDQALAYYARAWKVHPTDPRLLLEYDQLRRRKGIAPEERLELLEAHLAVVEQRDDLVIERIGLCNVTGHPETALEIAAGRAFHAWEGGEGKVAVGYANAHWLLGRQALEAANPGRALEHFSRGLAFPENLGVTPFEAEIVHLRYYQALTLEALGRTDEAREALQRVIQTEGGLHVAYYRAQAMRKLGQEEEAVTTLKGLRQEAAELAESGLRPSYFFSGRPSPIFEDDLKTYHRPTCLTALGLAQLGLEDRTGARNSFAQALALAPGNLFAHEEYKRL
jgi:tetratricopeptide (TPR) repeat protein